MIITYKTIKDLPNEQLYKLFVAVGWADEETTTQSMIDNFNKPSSTQRLLFLLGMKTY